jgi:protein-L-isoaspartate O-methyltransferase
MESTADRANHDLVDRLIVEGALWSKPLIAAFRATPRHRFLDRIFLYYRKQQRWREVLTREPDKDELRLIYSDRALITHLRQVNTKGAGIPVSSSSQPSLMAQMLEDLRLKQGQRVLDIGSGTGYNAALMAHVVGPGLVTSIDVDREVLSEAWDHLRRFPDRAVRLHHADGRHGFADSAPYDRIIVTAATPDLEPAWFKQLAVGGLLLAPLILGTGLAYVLAGTVMEGLFQGRLTRAAYFMSLRAEGEIGRADEIESPPLGQTHTVRAPWAGWFEPRGSRATWLSFIQSLVFYGLLRGMQIHYQTLVNGEPTYAVEMGGDYCWLGVKNWRVSGEAGRELAWTLWRSFLDAGGPRPTDFLLRARPNFEVDPSQCPGFLRTGPICWQRWELVEPFERSVWI